jgi:hypothetical protein
MEDIPGISFINSLRPITYKINFNDMITLCSYADSAHSENCTCGICMKIHSGFIAQEIEASANSIGYDFDGLQKPESNGGYYSLGYSQFIPSIVKAIQEQQTQITTLSQSGITGIAFSGPWSENKSVDLKYSISQNIVVLNIPQILDTADGTTANITLTAPLVSSLVPPIKMYYPIIATNNDTIQQGYIAIDTDGTLTVYSSISEEQFSSGIGQSGFKGTSITYNI